MLQRASFFSTRVLWWSYLLLAVLLSILLSQRERILLTNTLLLTSGVTAISLTIGGLLGVLVARTDLPWRAGYSWWLALAMLTPLHVQCAMWQMGWGGQGWLSYWLGTTTRPWFDGWLAAIWVHSAAAIPVVAGCVALVARRCERAVEELALLESSPVQVWRRVLLPQLRPAIVWSLLWILVQTTTEMAVTDFFRIRTWAEEAYIAQALGSWEAIQGTLSLDQQAASVVEQTNSTPWRIAGIIALGGALLLNHCWGQIRTWQPQQRHAPLIYRWGKWRSVAGGCWLLWLLLVIGFPLSSLLIKAGLITTNVAGQMTRSWSPVKVLTMLVQSPQRYADSLGVSLTAASCAALAMVVCASLLRWQLRERPWWCDPGAWLALAGVVLPGPLVGTTLIQLFNAPGWPWLNACYDRTLVVVSLAMIWRCWPWVWLLIAVGQLSIPRGQWELAALEGQSTRTIWQRLLAPQLAPFWLAALLLGWELSLGELAATIMVYPPGKTPLSVELFRLLHSDYEAEVAGLCLGLLCFHALGAWCLLRLLRLRFPAV